jgi:glycosyltransferase involved in cell wall biosynthesis
LNNKVCHISSVHSRYDTRIFYKECTSLQKAGYKVVLLVADGKKAELVEDIEIESIQKIHSRIIRLLISPWLLIFKAVKTKANVYHIHDPELLLTGIVLKLLFKKKLIFDIHENIEQQLLTKFWLPAIFRTPFAVFYRSLIPLICKQFHLIFAEQSYVKDYIKYKPKYEVVLNKPLISKLLRFRKINRNKEQIFYVGQISEERGFDVLLNVIEELDKNIPDLKYHLIGEIELTKENKARYERKTNVHLYGKLSWLEAYEISQDCGIGLSILKPIGNFLNSYSTKIFEYMVILMPFVVSDFELYAETVKLPETGLLVDPLNVSDISEKILKLIKNEQKYSEIQSHQKEFIKTFNWDQEERKLLSFYEKIISKT